MFNRKKQFLNMAGAPPPENAAPAGRMQTPF
jgi:hypothetical protein